jgi:hypothetical protein
VKSSQKALRDRANALIEVIDQAGRDQHCQPTVKHNRMQYLMAINVLFPFVAKKKSLVAEPKREAQVSARLDHRSIVSALDARETAALSIF